MMVADSSIYFQEKEFLSLKQLFTRAANGDENALARYVSSNGDLNSRDEDGMGLIHYAACRGDVHAIHQLRQHGADIHLRDEGQPPWKPMHYAIFHRKPHAEKLLIELGAQAPLPILKQIMNGKSQLEPHGANFREQESFEGLNNVRYR